MALRTAPIDVLLQPQLLSLIKSHLKPPDLANLRLANAFARAAVNAVVTTVVLSPSSPGFRTDLADAFPQASALSIELDSRPRSAGDLTVLLALVASATPALVRKLRRLELKLGCDVLTERTSTALHRFLSRCTSLQKLHVAFGHNLAVFSGQGRNSDERRASMQAQLAAISADPTFLAPASWPAHGCLSQLHLFDMIEFTVCPLAACLSAAMLTPSLHTLKLTCDSLPDTSDSLPDTSSWDRMGCLAGSLRSLKLLIFDEIPDITCRAACAAIAQLTSLVRLTVVADLWGSGVDGLADIVSGHMLPVGWSQLTRLTELHVQEGDLDLGKPMPCFPALQKLAVPYLSCASLSALFPLTSLTCVAFHDYDDEPAGAETGAGEPQVPQQWKARMRDLKWGFSWHNMGIISQLTSLTHLSLDGAAVGPTFCCSVAGLHALKKLALRDASIDERDGGFGACTAGAFRPSFSGLQSLMVDDVVALELLARWTNVPNRMQLVCWTHGRRGMLDSSSCGHGWLVAALNANLQPQYNTAAVDIFIKDDSGMEQLLQAASHRRSKQAATNKGTHLFSSVVLGSNISAAGICMLFQAAQKFPRGRLSIEHDRALDGQPAPSSQLLPALQSEHLQQLPGRVFASLKELQLGNCSLLTVRDLGILASAVPNLVVLQLGQATSAINSTVLVLVAWRKLAQLRITGCTQVTTEAAVLLLTMLPRLHSIFIENACACESQQACRELLTAAGTPT